MNKSLVFTPGCKWEVKSGVLFVEYESMTGEHVRARFDLSPETKYITDGHKLETLRNICEHSDDFSIRRVRYYEQENHMLIGGKMLVPTKVYFEAKAKKTAEETHNKLLRQVANSAYGMASRDWANVLADSARYIYAMQSRCSGKTLWLSSATSFADKQPLWNVSRYHDICKQWLKEPPTPYEFISDDLEDCEKGVPNTKLIDPTTLYYQDTTTGEMKPYEGIKSITPKRMRYRGRTWTNPESPYGRQGHMLITDITSRAILRDDDYLDVEVGDVMYYDDGNNGKAETDDHDKLFVWQGLGIGWKKLSDNNGYLDTDTVTEKIFKEEMKMAEKARFDMYKPKISKVIFNEPATIVFWTDGTKTIVKCGENDDFDPEKGIAMACMKKLLGTNKTGSNYLDDVKKYISKWDEDNPEENIWTKLFCELGKMTGEDLVNTDAMDIPEETENSETIEGGENNDEA